MIVTFKLGSFNLVLSVEGKHLTVPSNDFFKIISPSYNTFAVFFFFLDLTDLSFSISDFSVFSYFLDDSVFTLFGFSVSTTSTGFDFF